MAQQIKTALVVDDSRLARIALCKLLRQRGIEVDMAGRGTEGLEHLRAHKRDVVFMDYMMPDMDGFEAARRVLSDPACGQPPIVMYTSQDTDEDRLKAREIGIAGFLGKPTSDAALDEVLAVVAAGQRPAAPAEGPPTAGPAALPVQDRPDPEAVRALAREVAEQVSQQFAAQLRQELADGIAGVLRQATDAAEQRAVDAATARLASAQEPIDLGALEARAREAAVGAAGDAGASAARALTPQLVEEAKRAAAAVVAAADLQTGLQRAFETEVVPALRQDLLSAAQQAADAAAQAALDPRAASLESRLQDMVRQSVLAEARAARGGLLGAAVAAGVAAGLIAGIAAGLLF